MPKIPQSQLDHAYRMRVLSLAQQFGRYITYCVVFYLAFHCVYLCTKEIAGRSTSASLLLSLYGIIKTPRALALLISWVLTGSTAAWGYGERMSRKKAIARLHPQAKRNQEAFDPDRESSGITVRGDTGDEDL